MRTGSVLTLAVLVAGCSTEKLDPKLENDLVQLTMMPTCAASAPMKSEKDFSGLNGATFGAYLDISEACKDEWFGRMQAAGNMKCSQGVEYQECSIGNVQPGQSGIMVMLRRDDMLVLIRYAPIDKGTKSK